MKQKNLTLLGHVTEALKLAEEIQKANKTDNLDVGHLREAKLVVGMRAAWLEQQEPNKLEELPPNRAEVVEAFTKMKPAERKKAKAHFEAVLVEKPEDATAKLALEVLAELKAE